MTQDAVISNPGTGPQKSFPVPKRTLTTEFFVGLFALIGLGCLAYLAIGIAGMILFKTGFYNIDAKFVNVSGLETGAAVEIGGVPVGDVTAIDLSDTFAKVTLSIRDDVKLRIDDMVSIRTKGIIGDRYVRITPGGSDELIPPGGSVENTESTVDIEEIIGKLIHKIE